MSHFYPIKHGRSTCSFKTLPNQAKLHRLSQPWLENKHTSVFAVVTFMQWLMGSNILFFPRSESNDCWGVLGCGVALLCTAVCRRCGSAGVCADVNMSSVCKLYPRRVKKVLRCGFIIMRNCYGGWIHSTQRHLRKHLQKTCRQRNTTISSSGCILSYNVNWSIM